MHRPGIRCIMTDLHSLYFFSLDGKLFATSKFSDINIPEQKLPLLSLLRLIWFFSDRLFLLYNSSLEKTLQNARLLSKVSKLKLHLFSFLINQKTWKMVSSTNKNFIYLLSYDFYVKTKNFNFRKKTKNPEILHIEKLNLTWWMGRLIN
jgi:predicted nucleotide-binding protein (sugar kinase/HSP70/actin superfamily)